jgi:hypothetical protein
MGEVIDAEPELAADRRDRRRRAEMCAIGLGAAILAMLIPCDSPVTSLLDNNLRSEQRGS